MRWRAARQADGRAVRAHVDSWLTVIAAAISQPSARRDPRTSRTIPLRVMTTLTCAPSKRPSVRNRCASSAGHAMQSTVAWKPDRQAPSRHEPHAAVSATGRLGRKGRDSNTLAAVWSRASRRAIGIVTPQRPGFPDYRPAKKTVSRRRSVRIRVSQRPGVKVATPRSQWTERRHR